MSDPHHAPSERPPVPSPSLQSSAYALAHLRAAIETGDPPLVAEALATVPEWVSFYDVRAALAAGGLRLRMQPLQTRRAAATTRTASTPRRRAGDRRH